MTAAKLLQSLSDSMQPQGQQPTRLPRSWDSPGKNTGVGCHLVSSSSDYKMNHARAPLAFLEKLNIERQAKVHKAYKIKSFKTIKYKNLKYIRQMHYKKEKESKNPVLINIRKNRILAKEH